MAVLWLKGSEDFAGLDATDQRRLIFFEWSGITRSSRKHLRVVALKPNRHLAYVNELYESAGLRR